MSEKILVVIDVQNDLVSGSPGTKEAEKVLPNIIRKIRDYKEQGYGIIYTKYAVWDKKRGGRSEGICGRSMFGNKGGAFADSVYMGGIVCEKTSVIAKTLYEAIVMSSGHDLNAVKEIECIGFRTDICVIGNILNIRSSLPGNIMISLDASCCAGTSPENHEAALMVLKSNGILIRN